MHVPHQPTRVPVVWNLHWSPDLGAVRTETFLGREFLVVPATLVRSQVLHNNLGRAYLPPDAITDDWAELWNGIPVLVGPHPAHNGQPVSGRSPVLWEARGAGWLFHTRAADAGQGRKRLVAEVWLDTARAAAVQGFQEVLDRVRAGQPVELSTGFPAHLDAGAGEAFGEEYDVVMRPLGADHLVISAEMTGACSVRDGCGLGVLNHQRKRGGQMPAQTDDGSGGRAADPERAPSRMMALLTKVGQALTGQRDTQQEAWEANVARVIERDVRALNAITPSDQERANMLRGALQAKFGTQEREVVLGDVYTEERVAIFWYNTPTGPQPPGAEFYRVEFTEGDDPGMFTFTDPERVRQMKTYEPVGQSAVNTATNSSGSRGCGCQEEVTMQENEKKDLLAELGKAMATQFQESLAPVLEKIEGVQASVKDAATAAATAVVNEAITEIQGSVAALTEKVDGALAALNAERDAERQALVTELSTNERTPFTSAELEAKPLDELRKIAHLAKVEVVSYAGRGAPRPVTNTKDEPAFLEPVPYHTKPGASKPAGEE